MNKASWKYNYRLARVSFKTGRSAAFVALAHSLVDQELVKEIRDSFCVVDELKFRSMSLVSLPRSGKVREAKFLLSTFAWKSEQSKEIRLPG